MSLCVSRFLRARYVGLSSDVEGRLCFFRGVNRHFSSEIDVVFSGVRAKGVGCDFYVICRSVERRVFSLGDRYREGDDK